MPGSPTSSAGPAPPARASSSRSARRGVRRDRSPRPATTSGRRGLLVRTDGRGRRQHGERQRGRRGEGHGLGLAEPLEQPGVLAQHRPLQVTQLRTRVESELVGEALAGSTQVVERLDLPGRRARRAKACRACSRSRVGCRSVSGSVVASTLTCSPRASRPSSRVSSAAARRRSRDARSAMTSGWSGRSAYGSPARRPSTSSSALAVPRDDLARRPVRRPAGAVGGAELRPEGCQRTCCPTGPRRRSGARRRRPAAPTARSHGRCAPSSEGSRHAPCRPGSSSLAQPRDVRVQRTVRGRRRLSRPTPGRRASQRAPTRPGRIASAATIDRGLRAPRSTASTASARPLANQFRRGERHARPCSRRGRRRACRQGSQHPSPSEAVRAKQERGRPVPSEHKPSTSRAQGGLKAVRGPSRKTTPDFGSHLQERGGGLMTTTIRPSDHAPPPWHARLVAPP